MNQIYKVIWNKARNAYIVVSEFAKGYARNTTRSRVTRSTAILRLAVLLACTTSAITVGSPLWVQAANTVNAGNASGTNALAVGSKSSASGTGSVAVGNSSTASDYAVAIGDTAIVGGSFTYGSTSSSDAAQAIAIGHSVTANGLQDVVIGSNNTAVTPTSAYTETDKNGSKSNAIGGRILIGHDNDATGRADNATVLGSNNVVNAPHGIAIGQNVQSGQASDSGIESNNTMVIGVNSKALSSNSIALGNNATAGNSDKNSGNANGQGAIAIGESAAASAYYTIALGHGTESSGAMAVAVGDLAKSTGYGSAAVGNGAKATANYTVAMGNGASAGASKSVAIGNAAAVSSVDGGVALGSGSSVTRTTGSGWSQLSNTWTNWVGLKDSTNSSKDGKWNSTLGAVSIGTDGADGTTNTRQLTGLAAGTQDTDAVNVAQWKNTMLSTVGDTQGSDYNTSYGTDKSMNLTRLYDERLTLTGAADDGTTRTKDELTTDANIGTIVGDNKITFRLAKNLTGLDSVTTGNTVMNSNGITITNINDNKKSITLDGSTGKATIGGVTVGYVNLGELQTKRGSIVPDGNYVYNLSNITWDPSTYVSGRAATEDQLYSLGSAVTTDVNNIEAVLGNGSFGLTAEDNNSTTTNLDSTIMVKGDGQNITTKVDGTDLQIKLNKNINLGTDGSVAAGSTTINSNGVDTNKVKVGDITITENGIDGGQQQITNIGSGIDGKVYDTSTAGQEKWNNAASIGDVYTIIGEEAGKAAEAVKAKSGKNITVDADNKVNLNDDITLGDADDASKQVKIDGNKAQITLGGKTVLGTQDGGGANPDTGSYLTGLNNKTWDASSIQSGRAATEDQLKAVDDKVSSGRKFTGDDGQQLTVGLGQNLSLTGGAQADNLSDGNIGVVKNGDNGLSVKLSKDLKNLNSVTAGNTIVDNNGLTIKTSDADRTISIADGNVNMGGNTVSGVDDGRVAQGSTDAVNGNQLWQRDQAINSLGRAVNKLDSRVNRVGAGAAALAALHPLDFDPDDKWDFAAGYGNYKDASAVAVGAYYRPNEDTMFSIGGSFGGGENMVNAGVSFKLGQGNHVSTSRVAMAKEIKDLRKEIEGLRSALADVAAGNRLDPAKTKLFPDVASNHWAYNEIAQLHGNGIIEGYPDGTFKGDRMMTRYEFAMMVYREMQRGAQLSERIINEFEPELERIRVDIVAKDSEGNPTIERVRVIKGRK